MIMVGVDLVPTINFYSFFLVPLVVFGDSLVYVGERNAFNWCACWAASWD